MDFLSTTLSLEQQFQLRLMEESTANINREQAIDLLIQVSRLLMVKDNVIRQLMRKVIQLETSHCLICPNSG
jgi:hypothetical protein